MKISCADCGNEFDNGLAENSPQCCLKNLPTTLDNYDGEKWTCPKCGAIWEHICNEAEGCFWSLDSEPEYLCTKCGSEACAGH
jgi:hypothetical protein